MCVYRYIENKTPEEDIPFRNYGINQSRKRLGKQVRVPAFSLGVSFV